jgi:hypothetical protein
MFVRLPGSKCPKPGAGAKTISGILLKCSFDCLFFVHPLAMILFLSRG